MADAVDGTPAEVRAMLAVPSSLVFRSRNAELISESRATRTVERAITNNELR
jgi:hypothetical protein